MPYPWGPERMREGAAYMRRRQLADLFLAHGERCWWCRQRTRIVKILVGEPTPPDAATRDHYVPRAWGGVGYMSNLVLACSECNNLRSDLCVAAWEARLRHDGIPPQDYDELRRVLAEGRRWPYVPLPADARL